MRIGINVLFIAPGSMGGSETYVCNLIDGFQEIDSDNEYIIFTSQENDQPLHFLLKVIFIRLCYHAKAKALKGFYLNSSYYLI